MSRVSEHEVPVRQPDLMTVEADGQLLVQRPGMDDTLSLNVSAQAILELCDGSRNVGELSQQLADECDYPLEVLASDVRFTIAQLQKHGLITLRQSSNGDN